jgi:hypothetical protein
MNQNIIEKKNENSLIRHQLMGLTSSVVHFEEMKEKVYVQEDIFCFEKLISLSLSTSVTGLEILFSPF